MNYHIAHVRNVCYDKSTHNACAIWLFKESLNQCHDVEV